jgi:uncharacterized membrane protein YqjE
MALRTVRSRDTAGHPGLIGTFLTLCADLSALVAARLSLFVKESKTALVQILVLAACAVAAILFFSFGYIFLVASLIATLARLTQLSWIWIALFAAGVHFLLALICLLVARSRMIKAPFPELTAELTKDREWLSNLDSTSRPMN